nr:hypothetical protein [Nanoarchaeota archaeon]
MKSDLRVIEQMKYILPNIFTKKTVKVLAYCTDCLDTEKEVPLESRLIELGRETKEFETKHGKVSRIRYKYEHVIECREGHRIYKKAYWTLWEEIFPLPPAGW